MLEIFNLCIFYSSKVLSVDYIKIGRGLFHIKGESGSGKTSLFKCIDNKLNYEGLINRKGSLGVYYQNNVINDNFSLFDMLKIDKRINKNIFYRLLLDFNLIEKFRVKIKYLSKGEKQRAELSVLLSLDRDIYLLDEPSSSLNVEFKRILYSYLKKNK